jgi:hypothetical protein
MRIEVERTDVGGLWAQIVRCKAGQHYRIEAEVAGSCPDAGDGAGVMLTVQPRTLDEPIGPRLAFAPVRHTLHPVTLRGYLKAPPGARGLEIQIGLISASGWARVYDVRVIPILTPDTAAHPLAVPPPAYARQTPRLAQRVLLVGDADAASCLTELVRVSIPDATLDIVPPARLRGEAAHADVVLIPGDTLPAGVRTLKQFEELAQGRRVLISTAGFARLVRPALKLRTIEQPDDPMHATIACGTFLTAGFALHDVLAFASAGGTPGSFAQRQFVRDRAFRELGRKRGYQVFLTAVTDSDTTMDKPIGLFKPTPGGAAVVCDLGALEAPPSSLGETNIAGAVVRNLLGCSPPAWGQYAVPARNERDFREELIELQARYEACVCVGLDSSETHVDGAAVRLGHDDESCGLALPPRPALVVRTGLRPGDEDGIYAALLWLKRLVRPAPFACPYARYLSRRFRVFWLPLRRPWNEAIGLAPENGAAHDGDTAFDPGTVRAMIDLTVGTEGRPQVTLARAGRLHERCGRALPALAREFEAYRPVTYRSGDATHADGEPRWQRLDLAPVVRMDATAFADAWHRRVLDAGAEVVRVEVPRGRIELAADSLWRTDLAGILLEHVVGQICEGFVMNHGTRNLELDATDVFGESWDGYRVIRTDPATGADCAESYVRTQASRVVLAPGTAVCRE